MKHSIRLGLELSEKNTNYTIYETFSIVMLLSILILVHFLFQNFQETCRVKTRTPFMLLKDIEGLDSITMY